MGALRFTLITLTDIVTASTRRSRWPATTVKALSLVSKPRASASLLLTLRVGEYDWTGNNGGDSLDSFISNIEVRTMATQHTCGLIRAAEHKLHG